MGHTVPVRRMRVHKRVAVGILPDDDREVIGVSFQLVADQISRLQPGHSAMRMLVTGSRDFVKGSLCNHAAVSGVQQKALKGFRLLASIIVYLPTIVTAALSYTVAPKLCASWQNHDRKDFMESSNFCLEIGWLWGISSALILFFHADELSALIFGNENAAQAIQWMSSVPIFSTSVAGR